MVPLPEDFAYVLDFIPEGMPKGPLAQVLGEKRFTLLEVIPKPGTFLSIGERVYVGKGEREKVLKIKRRIHFSELLPGARDSLPEVITKVVKAREKDFVFFFNNCGPVSARVHSLDFLPGVGRTLREKILQERERQLFVSYEDIHRRIKGLDPVKVLSERILEELSGRTGTLLFVRP